MEYRQILAVGCPACVVDLASGVAWIDKYRRKARPQLASDPDDGTVFLSVEGGPRPLEHAGAGMRRSCQSRQARGLSHVRPPMATLMLEGRTDIRYIQQMLGHSDL